MGNKRYQEFGEDFTPKKHKSTNINALSQALNYPSAVPESSDPNLDFHGSPNSTKGSSNRKAYIEQPSTLPPLPPIQDASLAQLSFTHPGSLNGHGTTNVDFSYDRLEFLGDAYIELIATRLLFHRFPKYPAGRLSQLREMLVKNETLAEYAYAYDFDQRAKLPAKFKATVTKKAWTKTMGDMFEAYVAAVIMDDVEKGFQTADAWLCALWESKLSQQPSNETQTVDSEAKAELGKKLLGKGIQLGYRGEGPPQHIRKEGKIIFYAGVYLTGWGWKDQFLGKGEGLSIKDARAMAAMEALANPLTEQAASVKRKFDETVRAEREQRALEQA
ncbi:ribonuclease III, partial [Lecanoromycetidae sp. Uapishka_2]